jgi:TIR- and PNP-associating SLOG family/Calcineurin-like phosphoesterase/CHAT domain
MHIQGQRIHIAGSASKNTSPNLLKYAHELIFELVNKLVAEGATFIVGVGDEPLSEPKTPASLPIIFDWTTLAAVRECLQAGRAQASGSQGRLVATVATSKTEEKIPDTRRELWDFLLAAEAIEIEFLKPGWSSGALRRQQEMPKGDILIILSGGEGVEHLAEEYIASAKPVIPLDLKIGSRCNDGSGGASRLAGEALAQPDRFARILDPTAAGNLFSRLTTRQGRRPVIEVVEAVVRLIHALGPSSGGDHPQSLPHHDRSHAQTQKELQATVEKRTQQEVKAFRQDHQQYMADSDNCIRILHLSDIHLGTVEQANRYFSQLATDLTQNLNIKQLNYLVISGDIANRSTEEEYDAAFNLVDKLVKRYGLDPNRVVIVPGNHDLNWDLSEAAYPFVAKRKLPNPLPEGRYIEAGSAGALICDEAEYQQRFTYFSDRFYKKVYGKPYPLEYDQQAILHPCPQDKILFLALNSCWEIDHHYRDRAGIHPNAIANAVDQILSENYDDWLKIAVWHHPVNGSESMKNPAFLEQLAVHGFQLGIHGHIHEAKDENFQYDTKRGLRIIAAGTFGAPTHEQVTGIPLQYNLLTLDPETGELTVETRKKEKADGAWSADARWGDKNNPIPRYPIQLRYGSEKKKTDSGTNPPQTVAEGNSSNPQQSILSNVKVGGSMTVGSINQYYGFGTAPQPAQPTPTPPLKRTILFLASSPINEARLRLDVEMREIDNGLRLAQQRDRFVIEQRWAVRTDDLRRALLDLNPEIVHFCGHGAGAGGLVLENDVGQAKLASTEALARLFKLFTNPVRCVVLNACYSKVQADAICQHIDYVVGMSDAVSDAAAIKFAVGFYDALVRERSYEDAFDFGCNAIELENLPEELTPVLKKKPS